MDCRILGAVITEVRTWDCTVCILQAKEENVMNAMGLQLLISAVDQDPARLVEK